MLLYEKRMPALNRKGAKTQTLDIRAKPRRLRDAAPGQRARLFFCISLRLRASAVITVLTNLPFLPVWQQKTLVLHPNSAKNVRKSPIGTKIDVRGQFVLKF